MILVSGMGLAGACLHPDTASAQQSEFKLLPAKSPLSQPLLSPVPEGASWQVTISAPRRATQAAPTAAEKASHTLYAYASGIRRMTSEYEGKTQSPIYFTKSALLYVDVRTGKVQVQAAEEGGGIPVRPGSFDEFAWISFDNYLGDTLFEGRTCHVFQEYFPLPSPPSAVTETSRETMPPDLESEIPEQSGVPYAKVAGHPHARIMRTALVDKATNLPTALEENGMRQRYVFSPEKTPLILPPEFAAALAAFEKQKINLSQKYRIGQ